MLKKSKMLLLAVTAVSFLFMSCGKKSYNGFEVKKGDGKVDVILLPVITDNTSYDVGVSQNKTFEYPLVCYMAVEEKVKAFAELYNSFQGFSEKEYAVYSDFFKNCYYGEFEKCPLNEKDLAQYTAWRNARDIAASEASPDALKEIFDSVQHIDTFHSATRWALNGLADIGIRIYKFNNDQSWYGSKEEIFKTFRKEREGSIPYLELMFPSVKFVRQLPAE